MGLAGAKNKRKLAKDPNNTRWSKNTDSFGHRMLQSQGWVPGQYLGPQGAAHAEFHTAASASHIRVVLKEDNSGIGAKRNRGDECTGLNAFKEMLERLNGKPEAAIESGRKAKEDYQRSLYVERKFGMMRFVSGGFLVGDKMKDDEKVEESSESSDDDEEASPAAAAPVAEKTVKKEKKSKKRKADDEEDEDRQERKSKKMRRKEKDSTGDGSDGEDGQKASSKSKRSKDEDKKRSKKDKKRRKEEEAESGPDSDSERARRREKKEKKRAKKESKRKAAGDGSATEAAEDSAASTPAGSGTSTPVTGVSVRHLARRRFIAQKRMAMTDQTAMNQIFMIKT